MFLRLEECKNSALHSGVPENEVELYGTPGCRWKMFVIKKAFEMKHTNDHYVFMGVKSHKPGREISRATAKECLARESQFPGTFHIVNGFIHQKIWRAYEPGLQRVEDQFHCVYVSFINKTFNEPWSPSGFQDENYESGEESIYWARNKAQHRPYLIGGSASNRFFSYIQSIYAVNLVHDGGATDQLKWKYNPATTGSNAASNGGHEEAEQDIPDKSAERAGRKEAREAIRNALSSPSSKSSCAPSYKANKRKTTGTEGDVDVARRKSSRIK